MMVSLVVATINRTGDLVRLLDSLSAQTYKHFELIVVDQNEDDRLKPLLDPYLAKFPIQHLRSLKGVSRARNVGLSHVTGGIVGFPDDDCWYPPALLERVVKFFHDNPSLDGLSTCIKDGDGNLAGSRWLEHSALVSKLNVWRTVTTVSLFLQRHTVETGVGFDEQLGGGAGTPFIGGEDTDFPLKVLSAGFRILYDPKYVVNHDQTNRSFDQAALAKVYGYGVGMGRVAKMHKYPLWFVGYFWLRPLGGVLLGLLAGHAGKVKWHWLTLKGRMYGWWVS